MMITARARSGFGMLAVLLLAGCGSEPGGSDPQAVARGLFLSHCSACHQHDGRGLAGTFPPLADVDWLRESSSEQAIDQVLHGRSGPMIVDGVTYTGTMPGFAHLADHEIAAILTHVYALPGNDGRVIVADQVSTVRTAPER